MSLIFDLENNFHLVALVASAVFRRFTSTRLSHCATTGSICYIFFIFIMRPVVAQRHKVWLKNRMVVGSIPTRGDEIFFKTYISIYSLWCRGKARRWVLPLTTQCLQNSAENGELNVLHSVPSAYLAVCGIQREVDFIYIFLLFNS